MREWYSYTSQNQMLYLAMLLLQKLCGHIIQRLLVRTPPLVTADNAFIFRLSTRTPSRSREPCRAAQSASRLSRSLTWQGGGPKSSVDDLCTGRGVVLGRAATTLRSIETQPF